MTLVVFVFVFPREPPEAVAVYIAYADELLVVVVVVEEEEVIVE